MEKKKTIKEVKKLVLKLHTDGQSIELICKTLVKLATKEICINGFNIYSTVLAQFTLMDIRNVIIDKRKGILKDIKNEGNR